MLHEHAGGDEDQQQAGNEAVNTGGLGQSDTQNHGAGNVTLALGVAADDFTGTGGAVTFADTRADTSDQSQTGADAATCQSIIPATVSSDKFLPLAAEITNGLA